MIKVIVNVYDSKFGANPFRQDIEVDDNNGVVDIIDYIKAYEPKKEIEKPIPKCSICNKQSTGVIFIVGEGESAYACKEHEGLLARL